MALRLFTIALLVTLSPHALAQEPSTRYTVWSSVIFSRTGERTPEVLGSLPITLTSVGAVEQYNSGSYFRQRYLESAGNFTTTNGIDLAPINGMNSDIPDVQKLYVQAVDEQYTIASAQAFLQGLYPPLALSTNSSEVQSIVDPTGRLANGSYVEAPLDGYRYAQIHTADEYDAEFVYIAGSTQCPAFEFSAVADYMFTPDFGAMEYETQDFYNAIGPSLLGGVLSSDKWSYANAYAIYDYLSYQANHNSTAATLLNAIDTATNTSKLSMLYNLASTQQYAWFGNPTAANAFTNTTFPSTIKGSISTIAGNTLASKILSQFILATTYEDQWYALSLLFGDFEPMLSLFSLLSLPTLDPAFSTIPPYGSVAVFELFSMSPPGEAIFPSPDDLWVRFYFRNGTDASAPLQSYSMFGNGPDQLEMSWGDFQAAMSGIAMGNVGDWCEQCGAAIIDTNRVFCAYWNATVSLDPGIVMDGGESGGNGGMSPAVSGIVGAIVALVIAGMVFALLMLVGGVRFHRVKSHKSDLGGFKGSQKLASDRDLTIPKGGAVVGATVVESPTSPVPGGHERVGSWELKEQDLPNIAATQPAERRPSFEDDDDAGTDPFKDPVKPDERV